jgi:N-acetylmuramoyl-L-alanine amidase
MEELNIKLQYMKITKDILFDNSNKQVNFQLTPNKGGKLNPQYLIMHYTAVTQAKGSINWFLNKEAKASAHLIIDRDGSITQFAPFDTITFHAGISRWNGLNGLNKHSIGIELVNGGKLVKTGTGWICPVDKKAVPDSEVVIAKHKNERAEAGWHAYPSLQIETAVEIASFLVKTYGLKDVLGHEDIAPFRKIDPGPAFPMSSFRSRAMGRKDDTIDEHVTNTVANIRSGPGTQFPPITDPLPKNIRVQVLKRKGNWSFVEVLDVVHELNDLEGWISSKLLTKA